MENPVRGEFSKKLGGEELVFEPSHERMSKFEALIGGSLVKFVTDVALQQQNGKTDFLDLFTIDKTAMMLRIITRRTPALTDAEAKKITYEAGITHCFSAIIEWAGETVSGSQRGNDSAEPKVNP